MGISITDLSNSIWLNELESTDLVTIPEIAYWVRTSGVGQLNSLIFTSYTVNATTLELEPNTFGVDELGILGGLYLIKFYGTQANNFLGAMGINDIIEYSEKGHVIRKLNRNEMAKTFLQLKSQYQDYLGKLIGSYKINRATPRDVSGIDVLLIVRDVPRYNRVIGND